MATPKEIKVDKKQLEDSTKMWHNFTVASKYGTYIIVLILVGLALAYVKFF